MVKQKKLFWQKFKDRYQVRWREVWRIFQKDLKELGRNKAVLVILIGLTGIPSLYAWFNIKAFWDPYSGTKNLKVAVVNLDQERIYKNQNLNFGDKIVENMKKNPALDWQFVDPIEGERGLEAGKYFAMIEIPKDFTADILSITQANVKKAKIEYKVNEKINAIAPKITDKGAEALKDNISRNTVETISTVAIGALGGAANALGDINPQIEEMKKELKLLKDQLENERSLAL